MHGREILWLDSQTPHKSYKIQIFCYYILSWAWPTIRNGWISNRIHDKFTGVEKSCYTWSLYPSGSVNFQLHTKKLQMLGIPKVVVPSNSPVPILWRSKHWWMCVCVKRNKSLTIHPMWITAFQVCEQILNLLNSYLFGAFELTIKILYLFIVSYILY